MGERKEKGKILPTEGGGRGGKGDVRLKNCSHQNRDWLLEFQAQINMEITCENSNQLF